VAAVVAPNFFFRAHLQLVGVELVVVLVLVLGEDSVVAVVVFFSLTLAVSTFKYANVDMNRSPAIRQKAETQ
jgi:hypothetical protein